MRLRAFGWNFRPPRRRSGSMLAIFEAMSKSPFVGLRGARTRTQGELWRGSKHSSRSEICCLNTSPTGDRSSRGTRMPPFQQSERRLFSLTCYTVSAAEIGRDAGFRRCPEKTGSRWATRNPRIIGADSQLPVLLFRQRQPDRLLPTCCSARCLSFPLHRRAKLHHSRHQPDTGRSANRTRLGTRRELWIVFALQI